jgi:hypothetical protein
MFQQADYVEAYWPDDGNWYPARILKVKENGRVFLVRFDGYSEKIELPPRDLRKPVQSDMGGGNEEEGVEEEEGNEETEVQEGRGEEKEEQEWEEEA